MTTPRVPSATARPRKARATRFRPGIRRLRSGRGFTYVNDSATDRLVPVTERERIRALAIPPAWQDVWINPSARARIQATGRDAKGRKQYIYQAAFRAARSDEKYSRLAGFGRALPKLRTTVAADLRRHGLPQQRVLAALVVLLDQTAIRVGNDEYARQNGTAGLTTLERANVEVSTSRITFDFVGKGGKRHTISLRDPRVARVLNRCGELPGDSAFGCVDAFGVPRRVTSEQVNEYIRKVTGEKFTAKDFRTWHGSVTAAKLLANEPQPVSERAAARTINVAMRGVAELLGNTPSVCRESYVHPAVLDAYRSGRLQETWRVHAARWRRLSGDPSERLFLSIL